MLPKAAETPFLAAAVLRNPEAMRTFYHAQGYCVVEEALSEAECDELNRTVEPFLVRQPEDEKYKPLMNPDRENPIFAAAVRHTNLVRISELLLQWKIEALQTMYYWKPPGALGLDLHQDNFYVQSNQDSFASAWVALDDADLENGPLIVYPGSHVEPVLPVHEVPIPLSGRPLYPNARGKETVVPDKYKPLPLEARKGAAVLIHGHLIHGSADNHSPRFRRAFLVDYIRQGAPFVAGRYGKRMRIDVYTSAS